MSDWEDRYFAYLRAYSAAASRVALKQVKSKSPPDSELGFEYKKRLKLANVEAETFERPISLWESFRKRKHVRANVVTVDGRATAIIYDGKKELVRELDPEKTILRVKSKKKNASKAVLVLERYNPWTADTIPWIPKDKDAELVYEKVEENVIDDIRRKRKRQMFKVISVLRKEGVKGLKHGSDQASGVKSAGAISSVVKRVLQIEFGIGARRRKHWRFMLKFMKLKGYSEIGKDARIERIFVDPDYKGWKRLGVLKRKISKGDMNEFNEFQDKITR
jgi:hypothetical protein